MTERVVRGIVISSSPIGEYDKRLELLTGELGRISAFARGARRPTSSRASVSRPFVFADFTLFEGKSSYSLKSAEVLNYFEDLSKDITLYCFGTYFLELARFFSRENAEAKNELNLIYAAFCALLSPLCDNRLVRAVFEIKLLDINGLCPAPEKLKEAKGSLACTDKFGRTCERAIDFVLQEGAARLFSFTLKGEALSEFCAVADRLIEMTVDRPLKSKKMLEDIEVL